MKAEVFVHMDSQLRSAHLILDYTLISKSFQGPKCIIKARDPRLQRISITTLGFLLFGLILKGAVATEPIPEGILKVASPLSQIIGAATSSPIASIEEEEVVNVPNYADEFEVFNRAWSPKTLTFDLSPPFSPLIDKIGIQRKPRSRLQDLLEFEPGKDATGKAA